MDGENGRRWALFAAELLRLVAAAVAGFFGGGAS